MSFNISDADFERGKKYMTSLRVEIPEGMSKAEEKQFVTDWVRLNSVSDQEIDDQLEAISKGKTPGVASKPLVEKSPVPTLTRPTGNIAAQWKKYVTELAKNGVINKYTGGGSVAEIKGYIDAQLATKGNLAPDKFTKDELEQINS